MSLISPDRKIDLSRALAGHPKSLFIPFDKAGITFGLGKTCFFSGWPLSALKFLLKTIDYCVVFKSLATRDLSQESEEERSFLEQERDDEMMREKKTTIEKMMEECVALIDECVAHSKEFGSCLL